MGKIRNRKYRVHKPASKCSALPEGSTLDNHSPADDCVSLSSRSYHAKSVIDVNALISELQSELEANSDTRSVVTSKSLRQVADRQLKKKDKLKVRNAVRLKQMMLVNDEREEAINKKKREQTVIVGDMKPLEDALPTLNWLMNNSKSNKSSIASFRKPRSIEKEAVRKKDMMQDLELLKAAAASSGSSNHNQTVSQNN